MIAAVVPAAGIGARFTQAGDTTPKQFRELAGMPLFRWSLSVICSHPKISSVVVMLSSNALGTMGDEIKSILDSPKISVTAGGATRQQSVHLGLEHLAKQSPMPEFVIVHDVARPFLTTEMIDDTIDCLTKCGACTLAIPLTDTIKRVSDGVIEETLDRSSLYLIQTPQGGRFDWLLAAHRQAAEKGTETTDDAAIMELAGHKVSIVSGSRYNLKVTNPEDLKIAEALAPMFLPKISN